AATSRSSSRRREVREETTVEGGSPPQTPQTGPTQAPAITKPVLIGRKLGMIQQFREDGSVVGTTVIAAEANVVTQVRTKERDGYSAIKLGFGRPKKKRLSKGALGHLKQLPPLEHLREVRLDDVAGFWTGRNLQILKTDPSRALRFIAGAVPGGRNGIVMVRKA